MLENYHLNWGIIDKQNNLGTVYYSLDHHET